MVLKRLRVSTPYEIYTNVYIIQDEISKETLVVDPGGEVDKIVDMLNILQAKLKYIFLTHCHGDHIGGVCELKEQMGGKVLIHRYDAEGLTNPNISLTNYLGIDANFEADARLQDGDLLHLGDLELRVIHTPGHTKGGASLYCEQEGFLISGDTLFRGTWGRTDLPTSSLEDIMDSIINKLMILPDETIVYPGHGRATMIRDERPIYLELKPRLD
ncbi:MAG: MBL fold metallo-hydrolase [Clostridia bacterium]|nr:MBL fold metallo-hydrolase [Clostridia bacterium]